MLRIMHRPTTIIMWLMILLPPSGSSSILPEYGNDDEFHFILQDSIQPRENYLNYTLVKSTYSFSENVRSPLLVIYKSLCVYLMGELRGIIKYICSNKKRGNIPRQMLPFIRSCFASYDSAWSSLAIIVFFSISSFMIIMRVGVSFSFFFMDPPVYKLLSKGVQSSQTGLDPKK